MLISHYYDPHDRVGWFRICGVGVAWKPVTAFRYFSERHGYVRWRTVGRWRWRWLGPRQDWRGWPWRRGAR